MNDFTIIATFKLNQKIYVYYTNNENKIFFSVLNYNNEVIKISDLEKDLMISLLPKIMISFDSINHIEISNISYKNKIYKMFLDKISGFKFFKECIDNKLVIPNYEEVKGLIYSYNENVLAYDKLEGELSNKEKNINSKDYIKKIVLNGLVSLECVILSSSLLSPSKISVMVDSSSNMSVDFTKINIDSLLKQNSNLTKNQKKLIVAFCKDFIKENSEYLREDILKNRISTLKICKENIDEKNILAYYDYANNTITINLEEEDINYDVVFAHELLHSFQPEVDSFLNETITEIIANEYTDNLDSDNYAYTPLCYIEKALFEIIGVEPNMKYTFDNNKRAFIEALCNIDNDEIKAYKFLCHLNNMCMYNQGRNDINIEKDKQIILQYLSEYYDNKYERKIEEDNLMMLYLNKSGLINEKVYVAVDGEKELLINVDKPYFNEKLKKEFKDGMATVAKITKINVFDKILLEDSISFEEAEKYRFDLKSKGKLIKVHYNYINTKDGKKINSIDYVLEIDTYNLQTLEINEDNRFETSYKNKR